MRFIFLLSSIVSLIVAQTPYEKGKELYKAKACYSCHGHQLEGIHNFPRLANRAKGYLSYKLSYFRSGKADSQPQEMMITFATDLSDEDIENLSVYFSDYVEETQAEKYDDKYEVHGDGGS